ncbi:hypothetical protein OIV19_23525 [Brucella sp. HL-2]|nr:hypothetical protein [Brucella sp. HL-2]MCV9910508.1 hypothetical protein [Brucella sp. HL-2]
MYAEVVHPDSMKPVPIGQQGVLLLTSLFPFQRVMPLIRYATGDVARNLGYGCACGDPGLKIRLSGRTKHCVKLISETGEDLYFGTREIGEAVYAHHALSQFPFPRFCATTRTVDGRKEICLHVEAVNLEAFDQEGVTNAIRTSLMNDCPELNRAMQNVDFKVKYYQRGGLSDHWKIYPER